MLVSLQKLRRIWGAQAKECKIGLWKYFSRVPFKLGHSVARCHGVSIFLLHSLHFAFVLFPIQNWCFKRLQWPVMNWTSSYLAPLFRRGSNLESTCLNQSFVCLQNSGSSTHVSCHILVKWVLMTFYWNYLVQVEKVPYHVQLFLHLLLHWHQQLHCQHDHDELWSIKYIVTLFVLKVHWDYLHTLLQVRRRCCLILLPGWQIDYQL